MVYRDSGPYHLCYEILWFRGAPIVAAGINMPDTHQLFIFSAKWKRLARPCSLHIPLFICLPYALIFICIYQSIHHHSSLMCWLSPFLPASMTVYLLCLEPIDIEAVTLEFMRHVMVCIITVFTPWCVSVLLQLRAEGCFSVAGHEGCTRSWSRLFVDSVPLTVFERVYLCRADWVRQFGFCCLV